MKAQSGSSLTPYELEILGRAIEIADRVVRMVARKQIQPEPEPPAAANKVIEFHKKCA